MERIALRASYAISQRFPRTATCQRCRDIYDTPRHAFQRRKNGDSHPLECDKENEWFTEELPSRKYGGYRSRFAPVNSTIPAVTWPDVGQTWGVEELLVDFCRSDARVMGH